jgi:dephospho-CoA kinase
MFHIGLTGNVASGKSTVARLFAAWGATLVEADQLVREVQQPGSSTLLAIAERFGTDVLDVSGALDRVALRRRVMGNEVGLAHLNAIVHPAVQQRRAELVARAHERGDLIVVSDIPLLFEVLDPAEFDVVVLVDAPEDLRRERLVELRGLTAHDADRMIASQQPSDTKRSRSHEIIDNTGTLADLERAAWDAWRSLRAQAAVHAVTTPGALLAVVAHPGDAALTMGGTLARYTDAGHDTYVVSATNEVPPEVSVGEHTALGLSTGGLTSDDAQAETALAEIVRRLSPAIILTLDPQRFGGHPDHRVVHTWATQAAGSAHVLSRVPDDTAASRGAIGVDVRPWGDIALQLEATVDDHCNLLDQLHGRSTSFAGREWFEIPDAETGLGWDLFEVARRG